MGGLTYIHYQPFCFSLCNIILLSSGFNWGYRRYNNLSFLSDNLFPMRYIPLVFQAAVLWGTTFT